MGTVALVAPTADGGAEGTFVAPAFDGKPVGRVRRLTVTFSSSYATGGDTVPLATLGLRNVNRILVEPGSALGFEVALGGTSAAPKLLARIAATGGSGAVAEVANAVNLSAKSAVIWFIGD